MVDHDLSETSFRPAVSPPDGWKGRAEWYIFRRFDLLLADNSEQSIVPLLNSPSELGLEPQIIHYLGASVNGEEITHYFAADLDPETEPPKGMAFIGLRAAYGRVSELAFQIAGQAVQIVNWDRTHRYCGRCGHETEDSRTERAKLCPNCGLSSYPRISPAMIVRVERTRHDGTREILLARNQRFPSGFYSVLAGFVEPGETLEECVRREVYEEAGIRISNIRYFGSQPWPFPHSLMIAFTADYESGEIVVDEHELDEANWFTYETLPHYPPPPSIANRLIETWRSEAGS